MDGGCWFENVSLLTCSTLNNFSEELTDAFVISSWVDQMGNVHGRVDGANENAEALLIGSHMVRHLFLQFILNKIDTFLDSSDNPF